MQCTRWTVDIHQHFFSGLQFDPNDLTKQNDYEFTDNNMGFTNAFFYNNPAHEHNDADGVLWSTAHLLVPLTNTHFKH